METGQANAVNKRSRRLPVHRVPETDAGTTTGILWVKGKRVVTGQRCQTPPYSPILLQPFASISLI